MTEAMRTQHGYLLGNIPLFPHFVSICYESLFWTLLLLCIVHKLRHGMTIPSLKHSSLRQPPVSWVRCNPSTFISLLCLIFLVAVGFLYWILLLSCIKLAKTCILKGAVYWTEAVWVGDVYKTPTPIVGMDKKVRLDTLMCGKRLDFYLGHADVCMP